MTASGVGSTRLEDVQLAAGVGPSQIYHYFADKADLVRAVIQYRGDTIVGGQQTALADIASFEDLHAWADNVVAQQSRLGFRGGCPIGSLSSELADIDPVARRQLVSAFDAWSDALRNGLTSIRDRGVLALDVDIDAFAATLLAAAQGGLLLGQAQQTTRPLHTALHTIINLFEQAASSTTSTALTTH
jgi:TetR/AcrR family transcriptional repressor of nem operon